MKGACPLKNSHWLYGFGVAVSTERQNILNNIERIGMRLKEHEQNAIVSTVKCLDQNARVYLFGSRVDDRKKGGDIDLLVMSTRFTSEDKRAIKIKLYELIGEQKIDIVLAADDSDPFVKLALETGVEL